MGCGASVAANDLKPYLKMLGTRIQIIHDKKLNLAKQEKKKVGDLLTKNEVQRARILVEGIIRTDFLLEAYELVKLEAELLIPRLNVFDNDEAGRPPSKEISQQVGTLLYAAWLWCSEVPELEKLSTQLKAKYGAAHARDVIDNKAHHLHERVIKVVAFATSSDPPDHGLVECYLEASGGEWRDVHAQRPAGAAVCRRAR